MVLKTLANGDLADRQEASARDSIDSLSKAEVETTGILRIESIVRPLAATLHNLSTNHTGSMPADLSL
jgi:hypothetical protein